MVTMSNANAKAGFDYAEMLARVQTLSEVQALQHTFLQQQAERLHEQMSEIGEISRRFAKEFSELVQIKIAHSQCSSRSSSKHSELVRFLVLPRGNSIELLIPTGVTSTALALSFVFTGLVGKGVISMLWLRL